MPWYFQGITISRHDVYQLSTAVDNSICKALQNLVGNCQRTAKLLVAH